MEAEIQAGQGILIRLLESLTDKAKKGSLLIQQMDYCSDMQASGLHPADAAAARLRVPAIKSFTISATDEKACGQLSISYVGEF